LTLTAHIDFADPHDRSAPRLRHAFGTPRAVLVAEAAHGIHPTAGQGLNMSLRDIAALADILREHKGRDIGDRAVLKQFQSERPMDNLSMAFATDGLTMLFSNDFIPVSLLRKAGLHLVSRLSFAKRFFMEQAMGLGAFKKAADISGKRRPSRAAGQR